MNSLRNLLPILAPLLLAAALPAHAWYPRDAEARIVGGTSSAETIIGSNRYYHVAEGETLIQLGRSFGLGFPNMAQANPGLDPWIPTVGARVVLPYATILPAGLDAGITINLADYRLYLLEESDGVRSVRIYPVGIGVEGWETPLGDFRIMSMSPRPTWHVPDSIRAEDPTLPRIVPPGPDNPLGDYWMAFSEERHGIHGTNEPYGVGRRVSHGCIRLYPEDIKDLYRRVRVGTPVKVTYQPIKLARHNGRLYIEVHPDYLGSGPKIETVLARHCAADSCQDLLDPEQLRFAARRELGYPLNVSRPGFAFHNDPAAAATKKGAP